MPALGRLLCTLPDRVRDSGNGGRSRIGQDEFVPGKFEKSLLIDAPPIWKRTTLKVIYNDFICLTDRVRTKVGNAPLHGRLVFF